MLSVCVCNNCDPKYEVFFTVRYIASSVVAVTTQNNCTAEYLHKQIVVSMFASA